MVLGFVIGRAIGKAAKAAFVPGKSDAPSMWDVKERFIHNSIKNYNDPRLAGWFQNYKHAPIDSKS
ncbi:hypothetical protein [Alicyclobacillus fastidiosus]|uniref:Uncharacterized protein n=1 Tax=Alicyclobacillus fastidiosus TaxID=392011 RepID=A0ABV5AK38_9BACL|nr:hypothetical protein [Alicyclobacillus fastidiosus]WEH10995.1 hypothetical protein PYS47_07195 [Alicyclobacillus fastidiosus]